MESVLPAPPRAVQQRQSTVPSFNQTADMMTVTVSRKWMSAFTHITQDDYKKNNTWPIKVYDVGQSFTQLSYSLLWHITE